MHKVKMSQFQHNIVNLGYVMDQSHAGFVPFRAVTFECVRTLASLNTFRGPLLEMKESQRTCDYD